MKNLPFPFCAWLLTIVCLSTAAFAQKLKPEEVVARHLESIGTIEARGAAKTRMAVGTAIVTFISQKNHKAQGRIVMASVDDKNFLGLHLNTADYPGERFSFDGKKAKVATILNGQRSLFGNFVGSNDILLRDSLLGSVLSSSWALLDLERSRAKLSFDGTKRIGGREHYVLGYSAKGGGDLDISLFFDKDTFQHVRTEYRRTYSAGIGVSPDQSSGFSETHLKVVEDYSQFKKVNGLTLPHSYTLLYSITGQRGTTEIEWAYSFEQFSFNQTFDANTFDADTR